MVLDLGGIQAEQAAPGGLGSELRAGRRGAVRRAGSGLLYERVVDLVERLIADQELAPGDLLPSYTELAEQAGVSLITVRRALDELERAGRVRRHQGLGTFVARPRIVTAPGRTGSLLGTLGGDGRPEAQLATTVLGLERGQPSDQLREALRMEAGEQVWHLRRLRLLDGEPAVLETSVIPVALAAGLDGALGRLDGSLYGLLASEYGLVDAYEEQYLEVIGPTQDEVRLLKLPKRAQVVRIRGLSIDPAGLPFDCFEQLYPATEFAFAISGSGTRQLLPAPGHRDWGVRGPE